MGVVDPSVVDEALVAVLQNDTAIKGLLPDGVYWDVAPPAAVAFAVVSLVTGGGVSVFGGRVIDDTLYAVKAVVRDGHGSIASAAAAIDAVLDEGTLSVTGFEAMYRDDLDGRIRFTEIDDFDRAIRWQHRGARYHVQISHDPIGVTRSVLLEQRR
jgi:hypothetical protein